MKEGEQCRWTSSYCKRVGGGGHSRSKCASKTEMKYCEEGLKCTDDPNDADSGFCRKGGKTFSNTIKSESTLKFCFLKILTPNVTAIQIVIFRDSGRRLRLLVQML